MTTYDVAQDGSGDFRTLGEAAEAARAGDVFIVHEGVYREVFQPRSDTTWQAVEGGWYVIDGGWKGNDLGAAEDNAAGLLIAGDNITVRGFEIRNVPGRGIAIGPGSSNILLEEFGVRDTFHGGLSCNGRGDTIRNVTLRRFVVRRVSMSTKFRETPVNGGWLVKDTNGFEMEDGDIEFVGGEGPAAGTRTLNYTARRIRVANTKHVAGYVNRAVNVLFEDCIFRQDNLPEWRQGDGDVGGPAPVGDEVTPGKTEKWQHSENVTFRRCIFDGTGSLFGIRNNANNAATGGYDTTIKNLVVEECTFIARPWTKLGVAIQENPHGDEIAGVFRRNVVITDRIKPGATIFRSNAPGVKFIDNGWTAVPQGVGIGAGNIQIDASELVAPFATPFAIENVRPVAGGVVAARGWGALPAGPEGPEPPVEPPPPDPEPEPAPWRQGLEERERRLLANCEVYAAGEPGGLPGHMLMLLTAKLAGMLDAAVEDGL